MALSLSYHIAALRLHCYGPCALHLLGCFATFRWLWPCHTATFHPSVKLPLSHCFAIILPLCLCHYVSVIQRLYLVCALYLSCCTATHMMPFFYHNALQSKGGSVIPHYIYHDTSPVVWFFFHWRHGCTSYCCVPLLLPCCFTCYPSEPVSSCPARVMLPYPYRRLGANNCPLSCNLGRLLLIVCACT